MGKSFGERLHKALKGAPDMRTVQVGGEYMPPAAGLARARLVGCFELGTHEEEYEGKLRDREKVDLVFELSGPNHEPRKLDDGTLIPIRITVRETLSLDGKSNFFKLFAAMNVSGEESHMALLLGKPFIVEVFHKRSADGKKTYANLKGPNGYNVCGTTVRDPRTGEGVVIEVAPAVTELKVFIWDGADMGMWDSIYIPGEYAERRDGVSGALIIPARSKNVIQERIVVAKNWPDHPLASLVQLGGDPNQPTPEELARQRKEELKEWQQANVRRLKAGLDEVLAKFHKEQPKKRGRSRKTRPRSV